MFAQFSIFHVGKTLLAKAVASETSATFLRVVGSELIQKYLGDGPKLVRELFRVADEYAPSIVFIDEIDAVGLKRYDSQRYSFLSPPFLFLLSRFCILLSFLFSSRILYLNFFFLVVVSVRFSARCSSC